MSTISTFSQQPSIEQLVEEVCEKCSGIRNRRKNTKPSREDQVLRFLCKHQTQSFTEDQLRDKVFRNKTSGNNVRVAVFNLRDDLDGYFRYGDGRTRAERLYVDTPYMLKLVPNDLTLDADETFWDVHARNAGIKNIILFTQPIFFWNEKNQSYTRYLNINFERKLNKQGLKDLREEIRRDIGKRHPALRQVPCFHYEPCGESRAIGALVRWFKNKHIEIKAEVSWQSSSDIYNSNAIILGNSRTNRYFSEFQPGLDFVLGAKHIANTGKLLAGEQRMYWDSARTSKNPAIDQCAYAVVSRVSHAPGRHVTMVGANNGVASQQAVEYLTDKGKVEKLFDRWNQPKGSPMPDRFQILFRVPLVNFDTPAGEPTPKTWRPKAEVAYLTKSL